jgi:hypothetical protein
MRQAKKKYITFIVTIRDSKYGSALNIRPIMLMILLHSTWLTSSPVRYNVVMAPERRIILNTHRWVPFPITERDYRQWSLRHISRKRSKKLKQSVVLVIPWSNGA